MRKRTVKMPRARNKFREIDEAVRGLNFQNARSDSGLVYPVKRVTLLRLLQMVGAEEDKERALIGRDAVFDIVGENRKVDVAMEVRKVVDKPAVIKNFKISSPAGLPLGQITFLLPDRRRRVSEKRLPILDMDVRIYKNAE